MLINRKKNRSFLLLFQFIYFIFPVCFNIFFLSFFKFFHISFSTLFSFCIFFAYFLLLFIPTFFFLSFFLKREYIEFSSKQKPNTSLWFLAWDLQISQLRPKWRSSVKEKTVCFIEISWVKNSTTKFVWTVNQGRRRS